MINCIERISTQTPELKPNLILISSDLDRILPFEGIFNVILATTSYSEKSYSLRRHLPGYIKKKAPWIPDAFIKILAWFMVKPSEVFVPISHHLVDVIFNPTLLPIKNLNSFSNAIKIHLNGDCINLSRFYTSLYVTNVYKYDIVLVAHKACIEFYEKRNIDALFFTYSVNPLVHRKRFLRKKYDIVFIGRLTKRRAHILSRLKKTFGEERVRIFGEWRHNMVSIYNMAKIVLNISRLGELNIRVFEALGSGSFLLTDRSEEVEEFFKDSYHLVMYDDINDLIEKIKYYLRNQDEREDIARRGFVEAWLKHTAFHRIVDMLYSIKDRVELTPRLEELVKMLPKLNDVIQTCIREEVERVLKIWKQQ